MSENNGTEIEVKCKIAGCIAHFEGVTTSDKKSPTGPKMYRFRVHFRSNAEIHKHAVESVGRVVAYKARNGHPIEVLSDGAYADIYHDGEKAVDYDAEVKRMNAEEKEQELANLQAKLRAHGLNVDVTLLTAKAKK